MRQASWGEGAGAKVPRALQRQSQAGKRSGERSPFLRGAGRAAFGFRPEEKGRARELFFFKARKDTAAAVARNHQVRGGEGPPGEV